MLTPIEIQSKSFKSGGLGYDKREVDQFMREVLDSYEALYRENMDVKEKVAALTKEIQYYKTIEKTLQKALVLAEKTAEDTKAAAVKEAKNIENEALTKSKIILSDAQNQLQSIKEQMTKLLQQYEVYKVQLKSLAAAQIELLESDSFAIHFSQTESESLEVLKEEVPLTQEEKAEEESSVAAAETEVEMEVLSEDEENPPFDSEEIDGFEFIDVEKNI